MDKSNVEIVVDYTKLESASASQGTFLHRRDALVAIVKNMHKRSYIMLICKANKEPVQTDFVRADHFQMSVSYAQLKLFCGPEDC